MKKYIIFLPEGGIIPILINYGSHKEVEISGIPFELYDKSLINGVSYEHNGECAWGAIIIEVEDK